MNCGVLQDKKNYDRIVLLHIMYIEIKSTCFNLKQRVQNDIGSTRNVIISRIFLVYRDRQQKITFHIPFHQGRLLAFNIKCAILVDHTFHDRPTPRRSISTIYKAGKDFLVSVKALTLLIF
jgi:hypothetical protein